MNCPECGVSCSPQKNGKYHCVYCGAYFEDPNLNAPAAAPAAPAPAPTHSASEDIYENNKNGVVEIRTDTGAASGFIISKDGLVLTNAHAVLGGDGRIEDNIFVKIGDKYIRSHVIAIGDTDSNNPKSADLCLLATESLPANATSVQLGSSSSVKIGQNVFYIGNSKGEGICMTGGIVSDNWRKVNERYYLMTDAATNPGNSGGPLFNMEGKVVGVHVSARTEAVGMKYAIPIDTACCFLNFVEDKLKVRHGTLADNPPEEVTKKEVSPLEEKQLNEETEIDIAEVVETEINKLKDGLKKHYSSITFR